MDVYVWGIRFSSMKVASILGWIWVSLLMVCLIPFSFACATFQTIKNISFQNEFRGFCLAEKHDFWWFALSFSLQSLALVFDEFWHRFLFHFENLLSNSMFWGDLFVDEFSMSFLMQNGSEYGPAKCMCIQLFSTLFLHTSIFYLRKTYMCQKPRFPNFSKN